MTKIEQKYSELNDKYLTLSTRCIALEKELTELRPFVKLVDRLQEDNKRLRAESYEDGDTIQTLRKELTQLKQNAALVKYAISQ